MDEKTVSVKLKHDGIGLAKINEDGNMIYRSGLWFPSKDPELLDKELRKDVVRVIEDNGEMYKEAVRNLALPPTYTEMIE